MSSFTGRGDPPLASTGSILVATKPRTDDAETIVIGVNNDGEALQYLTESSKNHLKARLQEFATQVVNEAHAIEKSEHVGQGAPEVTAAHIDEAWWVTRRRVRKSRHPARAIFARLCEILGSAGFGVAASSLSQWWGPSLLVASTVAILSGFLIETYNSRD
jgi:hypothetical protein